jgi:hypothetical protein
VLLHANCTQAQIEKAQILYLQTEQTQNLKEQIDLLFQALKACYSAEIEANYLILKAEESDDVSNKIGYYKEALVSISRFQDRALILVHQDRINGILAELYEPIDKDISKIYWSKVRQKGDGISNFEYIVYLFGFLLLIWGILGVFRK